MNHEQEFIDRNHRELAEFVEETEDCHSEVTLLTKTVVAQLLRNSKIGLNQIAKQNKGYITNLDLVQVLMQELRRCTVDLSKLENHITSKNKEQMQ